MKFNLLTHNLVVVGETHCHMILFAGTQFFCKGLLCAKIYTVSRWKIYNFHTLHTWMWFQFFILYARNYSVYYWGKWFPFSPVFCGVFRGQGKFVDIGPQRQCLSFCRHATFIFGVTVRFICPSSPSSNPSAKYLDLSRLYTIQRCMLYNDLLYQGIRPIRPFL